MQSKCPWGGELRYEGQNICCYLLKSEDIPSLVRLGKLDIGICPAEWHLEHKAEHKKSLHKWAHLPWVSVRLALIAQESASLGIQKYDEVEICSSFPNFTRHIATELKKVIKANKIVIKRLAGSIEATIPGMYPFGVECIETGNTIKSNSLKIVKILKDGLSMEIVSKAYSKRNEGIVAKILSYEIN